MKGFLKKILVLFPLATFSQVGIGTTSPSSSSILDVAATDKGVLVPRVAIADLNTAAPVTAPVESLIVYNTTVATGVGFHYWDGAQWTPISGSPAPDTDWTIVANDMHNANTANVGVGTTAPSVLLHIVSANPAIRLVSGTEAAGLVLTTDASGNANWGTMSLDNDWTVAGNDMYSANTGDVEIGTIVPKGNSAKFAVETNRIRLENTGNTILSTEISSFSPDRGYELIGVYTDAGFDTNAIYLGGHNLNNTGGNGYDDVNKIYCGFNLGGGGGASLPITATAFNVASSRNYKDDITKLTYGLKDVLKINPVKYQYKSDKTGLYTIGFIAEELSEVLPEVVQHQDENGIIVSREEGTPVSMDYSKMNAVLVNAIKEQQAEIDLLEKENTDLTNQINKLERLLF